MSSGFESVVVCLGFIVCFGFCLSSASSLPEFDEIDQEPVATYSKFNWIGHRSDYIMPWTRGPNVCAVEEVIGGIRKRYHSECMAFFPRKICQKPTFIRYQCCTGYEKEEGKSTRGCQAVKPLEDLPTTIRNLHLKEFRNYLSTSGCEELLLADKSSSTYTVFAPYKEAFRNLSQEIKDLMSIESPSLDDNLLMYHIAPDRFLLKDLRNEIEIPTLYKNNQTLIVHRYSNGVVTVNCVRIVIPNQPATNGIVHVVEEVIRPIEEHITIFDVLVNDGRFGEFVTALELTQISSELKTASHYTVFAPTDAAFRAMSRSSKERIMNNVKLLKRLIYYHIIDCCLCSASILSPSSVRTLEGQKVNLSCDVRDRLIVNDVICKEVDLLSLNGIVHVIDEVLIPDSVTSILEQVDKLDLHVFLDYAKQAGMERILSGEQDGSEEITIFVPNDEAFKKLSSSEKRRLKTSLSEIMWYHTVSGKMTTKKMVGTEVIASGTTEHANGNGLFLNVNVEDYTVNDAKIISSDYVVANGVVHVIDRVLLPPEGTILDKVKGDSQLSILLNLLKQSGLDTLLTSTDQSFSWTLFAPTNAAFNRMDDQLLARLIENPEQLLMFLNYHLVERAIFSTVIRSRLQYRFQTAGNDWLRLKKEQGKEPIVIVNEQVLVSKSDVKSINGVLYVIDHVLMCPCLQKVKANKYV